MTLIGHQRFPVKNIMPNPVEFTLDEVVHEITAGPYGRCVYSCDNDVVGAYSALLLTGVTSVTLTDTPFTAQTIRWSTWSSRTA